VSDKDGGRAAGGAREVRLHLPVHVLYREGALDEGNGATIGVGSGR
jgi:hypothetical protein